MKRKGTPYRLGLGAVCAVAATLFIAISIGGASPSVPGAANLAVSHATSMHSGLDKASKSAIATELESLYSSKAALQKFENAPGMPTCARPAIPAATSPPGKTYGVPFLAAITNGQLLAGYDEWTANNNKWNTGTKTLHLYPWQSKIFDITGWVTGLLQLPNLSAQIPPNDVVFCDNGGVNCLSADPPAGDCIQISSQFGPEKGAKTPPNPITNIPGGGSPCTSDPSAVPRCPCSMTPGCLPFILTLHPTGMTTLTVSGVEPDGALNLSVTTSAITEASLATFTCENDATQIQLSTVTPSALPSTAPPKPNAPNKDYRSLQTPTAPLTGPLASAASSVGSDSFSVPAFIPGSTPACSKTLAELLNTYAGGWGLAYGGGNGQGQGLYYQNGGTNATVAPPGWAQFSATTSVVVLGLPLGPPPNFSF